MDVVFNFIWSPHFEECSPGVTINREIIFWELHFNCGLFQLALKGQSHAMMRPNTNDHQVLMVGAYIN
jgi:hypothetical protein